MGRLELLVTEIKATLDATLPHLATKAELTDMRVESTSMRVEWKDDLAGVRQEIVEFRIATGAEFAAVRLASEKEFSALRADLAEKPSKTYMWGVLTALLTAYACGLAALAILK
jgi:hypothetical protein